jgi:hypothetical protein
MTRMPAHTMGFVLKIGTPRRPWRRIQSSLREMNWFLMRISTASRF